MTPPTEIGAFLAWFRRETESHWATYQPRTFADYVASGVGGADWQQGTVWLGGLPEATIVDLEHTWDLRFPPDYRQFLATLHAVDRPKRGAAYTDAGTMAPVERPAFYNWLDAAQIRGALDALLDGILFDVEHNGIWPDAWGPRPAADRRTHLEQLIDAARRLVPIIGHRYLLAEPATTGYPVLSIHQTDAIVYERNLRDFLLDDFASLLGRERSRPLHMPEAVMQSVQHVPFWGSLIG